MLESDGVPRFKAANYDEFVESMMKMTKGRPQPQGKALGSALVKLAFGEDWKDFSVQVRHLQGMTFDEIIELAEKTPDKCPVPDGKPYRLEVFNSAKRQYESIGRFATEDDVEQGAREFYRKHKHSDDYDFVSTPCSPFQYIYLADGNDHPSYLYVVDDDVLPEA